jgi:hypothetical protein
MHYQKLDSLFWRVHSQVEFDVHYLSVCGSIFKRVILFVFREVSRSFEHSFFCFQET